MIQFFGPALDILTFVVLFNLFSYIAYAYLYKKEFAKLTAVDFRLSLVEILLLVINYAGSGAVVYVLGYEISWVWYYILIASFVEVIFFLSYKSYFALAWGEITGYNQAIKK